MEGGALAGGVEVGREEAVWLDAVVGGEAGEGVFDDGEGLIGGGGVCLGFGRTFSPIVVDSVTADHWFVGGGFVGVMGEDSDDGIGITILPGLPVSG